MIVLADLLLVALWTANPPFARVNSYTRGRSMLPYLPKEGVVPCLYCSCHGYPETGKCSSSVNDIIAVPLLTCIPGHFLLYYFACKLLYPAKSIYQAISDKVLLLLGTTTPEFCGDHQDTAAIQKIGILIMTCRLVSITYHLSAARAWNSKRVYYVRPQAAGILILQVGK